MTNTFYFKKQETETCLRNMGESSSLAKCIAAGILPLIHQKTSDEHHISCRSWPIQATTWKKPVIADKISRPALDRTVHLFINQKRMSSRRISHEETNCRNEEQATQSHATGRLSRRMKLQIQLPGHDSLSAKP